MKSRIKKVKILTSFLELNLDANSLALMFTKLAELITLAILIYFEDFD